MNNKWIRLSEPPKSALKKITFGALKGKSDINPQWRIEAMTEVYGECGVGWLHQATDRWETRCDNGEVMCFVVVSVQTKIDDGTWSSPVIGFGGNKIIALANGKPKPCDEGWKMAYTDALGTALKSLGVASEVYLGNFDGSKYRNQPESEYISPEQADSISAIIDTHDLDRLAVLKWLNKRGHETIAKIKKADHDHVVANLKRGK